VRIENIVLAVVKGDIFVAVCVDILHILIRMSKSRSVKRRWKNALL